MLLLYLHIAAAVIHLISCVMATVVHVDVKAQVTLPKHMYLSSPVRMETTHETLLEQNPMVWVAANEALTLFSHLIAIFLLVSDEKMRKYEGLRRTIEYSFTAGILQVALILGTGSIPLSTLLYVIIVNVVMQMIGHASEGENRTLLLTSGFVLLAAQIQVVMTNAFLLEGIATEYFLVMGVFYALFYIGFGVVKIFRPTYEDEIYILMSVTSKVTLSWVLLGNIFEGYKEMGEDMDFTDLDWRAIQWGVVLFSVIGLSVGIPLIQSTKPYLDKEDQIKRTEVKLQNLRDSRVEFKDLRY